MEKILVILLFWSCLGLWMFLNNQYRWHPGITVFYRAFNDQKGDTGTFRMKYFIQHSS